MGEELCRSKLNNFSGMPGGVRGKGEDVEEAVFLDNNVNDGLWIWYRLGLIVYPIWLLMLRMDTNVMMDYEFDTGWFRFLFFLIWIQMLRMEQM